MLQVAARPNDVDADWLTSVLRRARVLRGRQRIEGFEYERVGNGLMSDSFRFQLHYSGDLADCPKTVVGKFAAVDPTSKETAAKYGVYKSEIGFYRTLAPTVDVRVPRCYFAEIDVATQNFTLLMEDQAPARVVDQIDGCAVEDCATAIREAARLHGPRWADASVAEIDWMKQRLAFNMQFIAALPGLVNGFVERYRGNLEAEYIRMVHRLLPVYPEVLMDMRSPRTVVHGDFRLDNMLFDVKNQARSVTILDWGTVSFACGACDIAYFIGGSLGPDARRVHQRDLVRIYFDELGRYDLGNYAWENCWRDYRRFPFLGLFTGVCAPMMVERTERSDALFLQMVRKYADQIGELDSFSFWE